MPSLGFDLDILGVFETQNVQPDIRANTAVEDAAILSMVEHGLGVSILSQLVLQGAATTYRLCLWTRPHGGIWESPRSRLRPPSL